MVNLFPRLEIVGRVGWKRRKVFVSPNWCLVVSSRNFLWFSSSRETETRKFVSRSAAFLTVEVFACFPPKKEILSVFICIFDLDHILGCFELKFELSVKNHPRGLI